MDKKELLSKYKRNYFEQDFYRKNVFYAFSEKQLLEGMQRLGVENREDLVTMFGLGDFCMKSKAKEIISWVDEQSQKNVDWLKSLTEDEKKDIIEYELYNHECTYTWDIEPVIKKLGNIFAYELIISVWHKVQRENQGISV